MSQAQTLTNEILEAIPLPRHLSYDEEKAWREEAQAKVLPILERASRNGKSTEEHLDAMMGKACDHLIGKMFGDGR